MEESEKDLTDVRQFTREQRRVLGVLVEKGFTTPEYYPMTLKALIAGCNQRSNRQPIANYSESTVMEAIDGLSEHGIVAVVHTSGGRTERFRHYMRHKFDLTEAQLAILTELWLRGRQQLGELRTRASRMHQIPAQDDLRRELAGLVELGFVQSSGPLERRGIEVDHTFYEDNERREPMPGAPAPAAAPPPAPVAAATPAVPAAAPPTQTVTASAAVDSTSVDELTSRVERQEVQIQQLTRELGELNSLVEEISAMVDDLRQQLGA